MLRKAHFGCLIALCSIFVSMGVAANTQVASEDCDSWEVGVLLGGFKSSPDNTTYGLALINDTIPHSGTYLYLTPKYRFGGGFDITYRPACSSYQYTAMYFETENRKNQSDTRELVSPYFWPQVSFLNLATNTFSKIKTQYRFGTISIGSQLCINDSLSLTPSFGLSYAFLKQSMFIAYNNHTTDPAANALVNLNSKFNGIGPSVGGQLRYDMCYGFSFLGDLQYSALIGSIRSRYFGQFSEDVLQPYFALLSKTPNVLVSQVMSDLSLGYTLPFSDYLWGNFNAGWRFTKLFNATEFSIHSENSNPALTKMNSTIQGPFVRAAVQF